MKNYILIIIIFLSINIFAQDIKVFETHSIPKPDSVQIFKPSGYSSAEKYSLVILLHGWSGNYKQWNEIIPLQNFSDKYNFIIASPDGLYDSWYVNSPVNPGSQIETFIITEMLPALCEKYNVDKENIFISGLSMGGHGALYLFFKHQDIFKSAGSLSGILDITAFPDNWNIAGYLGKYEDNQEIWKKNSDIFLLDSLVDKERPFIFGCGTEDFAYQVNKNFYEKCLQLKIKATFISQPGVHNAEYWKNNIESHLRFFKEIECKK